MLSCRQFPGGQCDVYAVRVAGGDYVLKLARPSEQWRTRHEAMVYAFLPEGRRHLIVADLDEGFVLMRSVGAMNLSNRYKQPGDHADLFRQMGRRLRQLHETPLGNLSVAVHAELVAARQRVLDVVRRDTPKLYAAADDSASHQARWPVFEAIIEQAIATDAGLLCLLHGDYNTRQVLLDAHGRTVTAIVDYEYACLGPPVLDLLRMEMSGIRGRCAFYAGYGLADLHPPHARLFTVLDRLDKVISSRAVGRGSPAFALADLHQALDAAQVYYGGF